MAVTMKNAVFWDVFLCSMLQLLVTANVVHSSPIPVTLIMGRNIPAKHRFLQEPHGVTSQMMAFVSDVQQKHKQHSV
jgi:hypothetical protein